MQQSRKTPNDDILYILYIKLNITWSGFQGQWLSVLVTSYDGPVDGTVYPPAEPGHSRVDSWKPGIPTAVSPGGEPIKSAITHKQLSRIPLEHHNTLRVVALTQSLKRNYCQPTKLIGEGEWVSDVSSEAGVINQWNYRY